MPFTGVTVERENDSCTPALWRSHPLPRVLVVDHEQLIRNVVRAALIREGYEVLEASTSTIAEWVQKGLKQLERDLA